MQNHSTVLDQTIWGIHLNFEGALCLPIEPSLLTYALVADNSNKIRTARKEAIARGISFTDFTSTMTLGNSQQQLDATEATSEAAFEYYGLCLLGKTKVLREFTGKFSLFK